MNLTEFKAWFEGYTEELEGAPTKKQWEKIKVKVGEIIPNQTPLPVIVEKYREYIPWWKEYSRPYYSTDTGTAIFPSSVITCSTFKYDPGAGVSLNVTDWNALPQNAIDAYREVGRLEAKGVIQ